MCEGSSLELGNAFRGAVVRQDHFAHLVRDALLRQPQELSDPLVGRDLAIILTEIGGCRG
jgi:hypothetical protein